MDVPKKRIFHGRHILLIYLNAAYFLNIVVMVQG
ncbi:hypothetical protein CO2235_MP60198 [Cupriavidus oxalaticus]|uniref:Uncharacterized protein n=1 Tax=Cupriavidus oxalaticus TaxID=96344 RepID=A0A375FLJ4_9BURK|nr:hypothetical protein CO2235_U530005 [Cupriavidus oxalaticus]SPC21968.1 hypothetical protein CO2235_MP60198 [Cupriavidus oxalaticus]